MQEEALASDNLVCTATDEVSCEDTHSVPGACALLVQVVDAVCRQLTRTALVAAHALFLSGYARD